MVFSLFSPCHSVLPSPFISPRIPSLSLLFLPLTWMTSSFYFYSPCSFHIPLFFSGHTYAMVFLFYLYLIFHPLALHHSFFFSLCEKIFVNYVVSKGLVSRMMWETKAEGRREVITFPYIFPQPTDKSFTQAEWHSSKDSTASMLILC